VAAWQSDTVPISFVARAHLRIQPDLSTDSRITPRAAEVPARVGMPD